MADAAVAFCFYWAESVLADICWKAKSDELAKNGCKVRSSIPRLQEKSIHTGGGTLLVHATWKTAWCMALSRNLVVMLTVQVLPFSLLRSRLVPTNWG